MNDSLIWKDYNQNHFLDLEADHIFKIQVDKKYDIVAEGFKEVASDAERLKSTKYLKEADAKRYITSKYLLRTVLSKFTNIAAPAINFQLTANKKPFLTGIEFNVTHSKNLVVMAVSRLPIGIDIEFINQAFDFEPLLSNCFHPEEINSLKNNPNADDFYRLWTRKEAVLKATGEGLIDALDELNCLGDLIVRNNQNLNLQSFKVDDDYLLSIAKADNSKISFWQY